MFIVIIFGDIKTYELIWLATYKMIASIVKEMQVCNTQMSQHVYSNEKVVEKPLQINPY